MLAQGLWMRPFRRRFSRPCYRRDAARRTLTQENDMAIPVNPLSADFSVAPQLSPQDMAAVAQAGYKSVIINRPDFEGGPDQPASAEVIEAARREGLVIEYQPVVSGAITTADVERFAQLLDTLPAPVLAYCRSGGRCTNLYRAAKGG